MVTPSAAAFAMLIAGFAPPDDAIGAVPATEVTLPLAKSKAVFTEFGVAAVVIEVEVVESVN